MYPESLLRLFEAFESFPGIGRRSAERMAFFLLKKPRAEVEAVAETILESRRALQNCQRCNHITETNLCGICREPGRDQSLLCVVEQSKDLQAIESVGHYRGLYHVLLGSLALLEGIEASDLAIDSLMKRVETEDLSEIILATNPNLDGDATALFLSRSLKKSPIKLTRLARGLPAGSTLEFTNRAILFEAFQRRTEW